MKSNMYDWVYKTKNYIGGECSYQCSYCYVKSFTIPNLKEKYSGKIRFVEHEFRQSLSKNKIWFIGSCIDMFANNIPNLAIYKIFNHLNQFSSNTYILQSKNPRRFYDFYIPHNYILGTTIETNRDYKISKAPSVNERVKAMIKLFDKKCKRFITIEPIMDFDINELFDMIKYIRPDFINIGADSKGHNLPEPSWDKIQILIAKLKKFTIVKRKYNLRRLKK